MDDLGSGADPGDTTEPAKQQPDKAHPELSVTDRIFATLENAWFQRVVSMVAVFFGIVDGRYLAVLSLLILLSIHRSKSLVGLERGKQALIYGAVFFVFVAALWMAGNQWNRSRDNSPVIKAIAEAVGAKMTTTIGKLAPSRVPAAPPTVAPTRPKPQAPKPKASLPCAGDPNRPYKCQSNDELGQWITEESDKVSSMADGVYQVHSGSPAADVGLLRLGKIRFSLDIKKCCLSDMTALREEAIKRIGPIAKDAEEQTLWESIQDENKPIGMGLISPGVVSEYSPYLKKLGEQLKQLKPSESQ